MTLREFITETRTRDRSIVVYGPGDGTGSVDRIERFFDGATLHRERVPELATQFASFLSEENLVAVTTLDEFDGEFLLIDSSFEVVGTLPRDRIAIPELVVRIEDATFLVAAGNTPLLTEMSHHIEEFALDSDTGTLRAGVQELSRLDEPGTRSIYERLAESSVETPVYGRSSGSDPELGIDVHRLDTDEILESWFVVYQDDSGGGALVATEIEPNTFRGFWTFEAELTRRVDEYLRETYR